jgi:hypothetical protein
LARGPGRNGDPRCRRRWVWRRPTPWVDGTRGVPAGQHHVGGPDTEGLLERTDESARPDGRADFGRSGAQLDTGEGKQRGASSGGWKSASRSIGPRGRAATRMHSPPMPRSIGSTRPRRRLRIRPSGRRRIATPPGSRRRVGSGATTARRSVTNLSGPEPVDPSLRSSSPSGDRHTSSQVGDGFSPPPITSSMMERIAEGQFLRLPHE